jgi:hypothetical protein
MDPFSSSSAYTPFNTGLGGESAGGISWFWIFVGVVVAGLIAVVLYMVLPRASTRPVRENFYGGAVSGSSGLACGRMSSEAEALVGLFAGKQLAGKEEDDLNLRDLKAVLSKMLCMKQDLMAPQQTITAAKELGFATHMDIQPVADMTARCFSKTVPERDLSIQFEKWRDFGYNMISRLASSGDLTEAEVKKAEELFTATWKDALDVAMVQCIGRVAKDKVSPHDAAPNTPDALNELKPYDGLY